MQTKYTRTESISFSEIVVVPIKILHDIILTTKFIQVKINVKKWTLISFDIKILKRGIPSETDMPMLPDLKDMEMKIPVAMIIIIKKASSGMRENINPSVKLELPVKIL